MPSATLKTLLARIANVSALARDLAADPESTKTADVWRRMIYSWRDGGGISLENAQILARHLPETVAPDLLVDDEPKLVVMTEDRMARLEVAVERMERVADLLVQVVERIAAPPASRG